MINWNEVNLPGGMDKSKILEEISEVSRIKATQHCSSKHPAFFSYEDLYQEIFIKCVSALPKFEESKSYGNKHRLFFYRCADNLVLDMKRKHLFYRSTPCKICQDEEDNSQKEGYTRPLDFHTKENCPALAKFLKLNKAKRDLGWSFGSVGMENSDHGKDCNEDDLESSKDGKDPISGNEEVLQIELNDEMKGRLGERAYSVFNKLVENNYEPSKLSPAEIRLLKNSLTRIYRSGGDNA
jgi:hypothetical protein